MGIAMHEDAEYERDPNNGSLTLRNTGAGYSLVLSPQMADGLFDITEDSADGSSPVDSTPTAEPTTEMPEDTTSDIPPK